MPLRLQSKKKSKKKKKKPVATYDAVESNTGNSTPAELADSGNDTASIPSSIKKKKGKQKPKSDPAEPVDEDDGLDEIDRALKQLGQENTAGRMDNAISNTPVSSSRIRTLLSVEVNHLDADAEVSERDRMCVQRGLTLYV